MAWFYYGDQTTRRYRKGIRLRLRSLPRSLRSKIMDYMAAMETLFSVEILELRPDNKVLLEVWCTQGFRMFGKHRNVDRRERYTVFHLLVDENPKWVCESDLGRGLVGTKKTT